MRRPCTFHPTRCLGVPRIFLTAPHSATVLDLHDGQGEQCLHSGKLATSSLIMIHASTLAGSPESSRLPPAPDTRPPHSGCAAEACSPSQHSAPGAGRTHALPAKACLHCAIYHHL